jgi:hypothetical protein
MSIERFADLADAAIARLAHLIAVLRRFFGVPRVTTTVSDPGPRKTS